MKYSNILSDDPISQFDDISLTDIATCVEAPLQEITKFLGGYGGVTMLRSPNKTVSDGVLLLKVINAHQKPVAVLHFSQKTAPGIVARGVKNMESAAMQMGNPLNTHIIKSLYSGEVEGRSYAVSPWMNTLSSSWVGWQLQCEFVRPYILSWIRNVAVATQYQAKNDALHSDFLIPLRFLETNKGLPVSICKSAAKAVENLNNGGWRPTYQLDHHDLWKDNILLPFEFFPFPHFRIIDWRAANIKGYGVIDLLSVVSSLKISESTLQIELHKLIDILHWNNSTLLYQFLACMGHFGIHRECLTEDRYLRIVEYFFNMLIKLI